MDKGGVIPRRRHQLVAKFPKEARACFGVGLPVVDASMEPAFMEAFDYTEKTLVSKKRWDKILKRAIRLQVFVNLSLFSVSFDIRRDISHSILTLSCIRF